MYVILPISWISVRIESKMALEEGKDSGVTFKINPSRLFPLRVLQFFLVFLALGLVFSVFSMYTIRYSKVQNVIPVTQTIIEQSPIKPCYEEAISLENWIRPPSKLMHTMNDSELLWRASVVPGIKSYPFKRIPKIAFMFLTKGPLPMAPLWERFFKGNEGRYSIYIHSMPSYEADFPPSSVFYKRHIPSQVSAALSFGLLCLLESNLYYIVIRLITIVSSTSV